MAPDIWSTTERIFLSFWTTFCPFTPLTTQKIEILKKWKNRLEISSFYTSVPKIMIIFYTVPEIWHVTDVICFSFWAILLPLYPPRSLTAQKIKIFQKMKKTSGDIIISHMCTKNYDQIMYISWNMVYDEWMEKVTYRSGCPI